MLPKVYFAGSRAQSHRDSMVRKVELLFERVGAARRISAGDLVAIKLHFGERAAPPLSTPSWCAR